MDNYYPIEIKICSKNGWFTPAEAQSYYGRYSRDGVCIHWWGDNTGADNHDNIVNYMLGQAQAGVKSPNYVVSDNKITLMVNPDNVAWCQESGNPTEISFECQPTLGDEGYKKAGWLKWQLEGRYNKKLDIHGHNHWFQTDCPGTLDLNRIQTECDKWASGSYNPSPTPITTPSTTPIPVENITLTKLPAVVKYTAKATPTHLWSFNVAKWADFVSIKEFKANDEIDIYGIGHNAALSHDYYMTEYSFTNKVYNGFNPVDLELYKAVPQPLPLPQPPQEVSPSEPTQPTPQVPPSPPEANQPPVETPTPPVATGQPSLPQDTPAATPPAQTPEPPQVVVSEPVQSGGILRYSKAIIAIIGAIMTWVVATYGKDPDVAKYLSLATALLTAAGVYQVPNKEVL